LSTVFKSLIDGQHKSDVIVLLVGSDQLHQATNTKQAKVFWEN